MAVMLVRRQRYPHRPQCPFARPSRAGGAPRFRPPRSPLGRGRQFTRATDGPRIARGLYDQLVKRLAAWATGLPPRMQDLALAMALAVYNVASLIPETRQLQLPYRRVRAGRAAGGAADLAAPLAGRWCSSPSVFPGRSMTSSASASTPLPLGSAIAYYTIMDRCSTRVRVVISALLIVGIIRSQTLPGHTEPYDFFVAVLQFAVAGTLGILSHTRRAYLQAVETRAEQAEAERERQVALAAAEERTRIARELHDVVAHHVSLMAVQSEAAAALLPGRPAEAGKAVEIIGQTAREALTELRRLLGVLRGPADVNGRAATAPAPSISELGEVTRAGAPGRDRREPARRGQPRQAAARRGPGRVPDRAGGADQHGQAFRRGRGRGDRQL